MNFETFVGAATIFGAVITYLSFRNNLNKTTDPKKTKPKTIIPSPNPPVVNDSVRKEVPEDITFGDTILITPSLEELGVPVPISHIAFIEKHVKHGEWIKRDEDLVTFHFVFYDNPNTPKSTFPTLKSDVMREKSFTLLSPVSGLVTNYRTTRCRSSDKELGGGIFYGGFSDDFALPNILISNYEAKISNAYLNTIRTGILNHLRKYWKQNSHNTGGSYPNAYKHCRLIYAIEEYSLWKDDFRSIEDIEKALVAIKEESEFEWKTLPYKEYWEEDKWIHDFLVEMSDRDPSLKKKLFHLLGNQIGRLS